MRALKPQLSASIDVIAWRSQVCDHLISKRCATNTRVDQSEPSSCRLVVRCTDTPPFIVRRKDDFPCFLAELLPLP